MRTVTMRALTGHTHEGVDHMRGARFEVELGDVETLERAGAAARVRRAPRAAWRSKHGSSGDVTKRNNDYGGWFK